LAQIFPEWTNTIPRVLGLSVGGFVIFVVVGIWYYWSPWFTDVGYAPIQPIPYSHEFHVSELGLDCRYCHVGVEHSPVAMIPPTQTCMNCHTLILPESEKLAPVRASWEHRTPIRWVRIHKVPDYAFFDHSVHVRAGVGCESCHGDVASMEIMELKKPLSMGWCLDCHRDPDQHLRPTEDITVMGWLAPQDQLERAALIRNTLQLNPPVTCSGCHR